MHIEEATTHTATQQELTVTKTVLQHAQERNVVLSKRNHALVMHVARAPKQKAHAVQRALEKAIEKVKATGPGTWYDQLVVAKEHKKNRCKQAKNDAVDAKVAAIVPRLEVAAIPKMTVAQITLQLQWHRHFDPKVPPNSEIGILKAGKVKALEAAVKHYNSGKARLCTCVVCKVVEESGATDLASESQSGDGSDHDEF
ncbi:hypothetical protein SERLADRAFT_433458 [Serpula lacrymans var. lacrymans S7.9]|nr:uncharacterized protein SERLADRAFT_433458 [Serpula lacrymans var. lacrymans S7.9]EGO29480.1 hypothetical protein SERLADRAFT_433458 [Serpula lacrymans var. lacrymans S7.9]